MDTSVVGQATRTTLVPPRTERSIFRTLRGQKLGLVRSDVDAGEAAIFLIAVYEGFISLVKNSQDLRMHQAGQKSVIRFLESLRGRRGSTKKRQVKAG